LKIQPTSVALALSVLALLPACTALPEQESEASSPMLQQIAATASGDFATSLDETDPTLLLTVASEPLVSSSRTLTLNLTQQAPDTPIRRFSLTLNQAEAAAAYPLSGTLAPLAPDGRAIAECPVVVRTGPMGLSASTEVATCQFGSGTGRVGLAKELLFSGSQIRIADRVESLSRPDQERVSATELRFFRLAQYSGWVGVFEGGQWRIARDVRLDTANGSIEPLDAVGMSLGVIVQLDKALLQDDSESPILRLTVLNAAGDRTLARAWSALGANRIGLATPEVQVGLDRTRMP